MYKIRRYIDLIKNMGLRYIWFRLKYELARKSGLLKKKFPTSVPNSSNISLNDWRKTSPKFFFESRETLSFSKRPTEKLERQAKNILNGEFQFFNASYFDLGVNYDWLTNPDTGYRYDLKHWTEIPDYASETGDIKYVWEKSRFSYLYTLIRYDYHFDVDQAQFIFKEVLSWIDANPINLGPNWRCSQEISLRVLNWIFALYYYQNSTFLTEEVFKKIMHAIEWQIKHVYSNIDFSRIAVRNNHALTETLALYLVGLLLPTMPEAKSWKMQGKKWFEEEIEYQIYEDGTYLQFSMNYHRVVVQLLTWALYLSKRNNELFNDKVYERAEKSLRFLMVCQDEESGHLPNYGANDGALFFPLSDADYRDYSPQLNALYYYFYGKAYQNNQEDLFWYGIKEFLVEKKLYRGSFEFSVGGFYILKEDDTITFLRCGNHKDRPSQADNLHLDIWQGGENLIRDSGSYKYNTTPDLINYFFGTASHNTIMLGEYNQMLKGARFIWYNWTQSLNATIDETNEYWEFKGRISAYRYIQKDIVHQRIVRKYKSENRWEIRDSLINVDKNKIHQIWNIANESKRKVKFRSINPDSTIIKPVIQPSWYSGYYGVKEIGSQVIFSSEQLAIKTIILVE